MRLRKKIAIGCGALIVAIIIAWLLPLPSALSRASVSTLRILDRNGSLLYGSRRGGLQQDISFADIPGDILHALVATEDRTFWTNPGLSARGIGRALLRDIQAGAIVEGGSTITQQYVRTMLQPKHRGLLYKLREAWLALKVSSRFAKSTILENFLNHAYFGQQSYGIVSAAKTYFGKEVRSLSVSESALLIGLLNAPSSLNPYKQPASTIERRNIVLKSMMQTGFLTDAELSQALAEPLQLKKNRIEIRAPHFVFWQLQERKEQLNGLDKFRTTLDLGLQTEIEQIVTYQLEKLKDLNVSSAAVVVLDARTGDILSMLGSADFFDDAHDGQVNVAMAARQPGSAIKPFTYAVGLAQGFTAASLLSDIEAHYQTQDGNPYTPRNYDFGYHGLVRIREALGNSYNIAAVKMLEKVGVSALVSFLRRLGFSEMTQSPEHYGLALTLGDSEVQLLELARAYAIFARNGNTLTLRSALTDEKKSGEKILDERVAWLIADILSDNDARSAEFGRASPLHFDFPVAAKTGTTRNSRDNWTIGFTPERIVGVWVGNADNTPMKGTSGVTGAGPIFHDVMIAAMRGLPSTEFIRPDGIVDREICRLSGKLTTPLCPAQITEHFIAGTEPQESDDMYREVLIDTRNGLQATDDCDSRFVRKDIVIFYPLEVQPWARDNGWKEPPIAFSPLCSGQTSSAMTQAPRSLAIQSPDDGAEFLMDPLVPDDAEHIQLSASADSSIETVEWRVNGKILGTGAAPAFRQSFAPAPGRFTIEARAWELRDTVTIMIQKP